VFELLIDPLFLRHCSYYDFSRAVTYYNFLTERLDNAIQRLRSGNVLTQTFLNDLELACAMRRDIYDKCQQIDELAFPALIKSLEPLCKQIF
jgi:hypothetical protein